MQLSNHISTTKINVGQATLYLGGFLSI